MAKEEFPTFVTNKNKKSFIKLFVYGALVIENNRKIDKNTKFFWILVIYL